MTKVKEMIIEALEIRDVIVPLTHIGMYYCYSHEWYFIAAQNETTMILPTSDKNYFISFFKNSFAEAELLEVSEFDNLQEFYDSHLGPDWDIEIGVL